MLRKETSEKQCTMGKIVRKSGEVYQRYSFFGNDYQLWPVIEEGAIQGNSKMTKTTPLTPTNKQTAAQLLCQWGTYLFTHIMMEAVFPLDKNYRVKSEEFQKLLARLRI